MVARIKRRILVTIYIIYIDKNLDESTTVCSFRSLRSLTLNNHWGSFSKCMHKDLLPVLFEVKVFLVCFLLPAINRVLTGDNWYVTIYRIAGIFSG